MIKLREGAGALGALLLSFIADSPHPDASHKNALLFSILELRPGNTIGFAELSDAKRKPSVRTDISSASADSTK